MFQAACQGYAESVTTVALAIVGAIGTGVSLWIGYKVKMLEYNQHIIRRQTDRRVQELPIPDGVDKRRVTG